MFDGIRNFIWGSPQPNWMDSITSGVVDFPEPQPLLKRMKEDPVETLAEIVQNLGFEVSFKNAEIFKVIDILCQENSIKENYREYFDGIQKLFFERLKSFNILDKDKHDSFSSNESNEFENIEKNTALTNLCYKAIVKNKKDLAASIIDLINESETITGLFKGQSLYILALKKGWTDFSLVLLKKLPTMVADLLSKFKAEYDEAAKSSESPKIKTFILNRLNEELKRLLKKEDYLIASGLIDYFPQGNTYIHTACEWGNLEIIEKVFKITDDPLCLDEKGHSPFYLAAARKEELEKVFEPFIKNLKNKSRVNDEFKRLLKQEEYLIASVLIDYFPQGNTYIHTACEWGNLEIIEKVLKITDDPLCLDEKGHSPFYLAAARKEGLEKVFEPFIKENLKNKERMELLKKEVKDYPEAIDLIELSGFVFI